jgi:hypothetical protein
LGIDEKAEAEKIVAVVVEDLVCLLRDAVVLEGHSLLLHEGEKGDVGAHEKWAGAGDARVKAWRGCRGCEID